MSGVCVSSPKLLKVAFIEQKLCDGRCTAPIWLIFLYKLYLAVAFYLCSVESLPHTGCADELYNKLQRLQWNKPSNECCFRLSVFAIAAVTFYLEVVVDISIRVNELKGVCSKPRNQIERIRNQVQRIPTLALCRGNKMFSTKIVWFAFCSCSC